MCVKYMMYVWGLYKSCLYIDRRNENANVAHIITETINNHHECGDRLYFPQCWIEQNSLNVCLSFIPIRFIYLSIYS